jgi:hypothetical protein
MTENTIDKLMKPYWDEKFKDVYLGVNKNDWYGLLMKTPDGIEKLIVGNVSGDDNGTWFYDDNMFTNGHILFNLSKPQFNQSMLRYINKKYNLNLKSVS